MIYGRGPVSKAIQRRCTVLALVKGRYGKKEPFIKYNATSCRVSVPHTEMTCTTVPGTGKKHGWVANVGHQDSSPFFYNHMNRTMRYKRPVKAVEQARSGGMSVLLEGSGRM